MATARERMRLQQAGQQAEQAQRAQAEGEIIAQQKIDDAIMQKQAQQMRASRDSAMIGEAAQAGRMQGQVEGQEAEQMAMLQAMNPNPQSPGVPFDYNQMMPEPQGLQMGSQTIEGMQQLESESKNAMLEEAHTISDEAIAALQQNIPPQEIDAMIDKNVPPELNPIVKEMLNQKLLIMGEEQKYSQAGSGQSQGRPPSPVTAASNDILAETMQIMQPKQQEQQ